LVCIEDPTTPFRPTHIEVPIPPRALPPVPLPAPRDYTWFAACGTVSFVIALHIAAALLLAL